MSDLESTVIISNSESPLSKTSRRVVSNFLSSSSMGSDESVIMSKRSHSNDSDNVDLNASRSCEGISSIKPIVSAIKTLGLARIRPNVVSSVENNLSSTNTSFPDNAKNKLDFPALV